MGKNNIEEEVTITPIIKDLERIFNRIIKFIGSILGFIYKALIRSFWFCFKNILFLTAFLLFGMIAGYFSNNLVTPKYTSELILELKIDAQSQLTSDVNYFNSLIENEQYNSISELFDITLEEASSLSEICIKGSSTYGEKIGAINSFYEELDTSIQKKIDFESLFLPDFSDFENRFTIKLKATNETVFSKLEPKLLEFFERVPELQRVRKNTLKNLNFQKEVLVNEMQRLDTLKLVMNEVMIEQAKTKSDASITNISFDQAGQKKDFQLLDIYNRYLHYSKEIVVIDELIDGIDKCYEVHTHFSSHGEKTGFKKSERMLIIGSIFFVLGIILLLLNDAKKIRTTSDA